ncbi:hypothetical protein NDU88_010693 [Pleurodeles waltl]|uniref:SPATA31 domain-containing protein n=1 Tax=Pleurodeles waltl TaxID=8319 RepID=A0AAV7S1X4_PLEWA|nr:hypothetical protein NDU88_010693 [Pleurodeles waltl]
MAWKHARPNLSSRGAKRLPGLALVKRRLEVYRRMAWKHARPNLSSRGAKRLPGLALVKRRLEVYRRMAWKHARPNLSSRGAKRLPGLALVKRRLEVYRRMAWKHARPNLSSRGAKRLPGLALVKRRLEVYRRMAWKHARPNLSSRGAKRLPGLALVKRRLEVYRRMAWKHARPNLSSRGAKRLPGLALVKRRLEVYRRMAWKHARPNLSSRGAKRLPGLALVKRRLEVYRRMAWKHARPNLSSRGAKRLPGLALVKRRLEVYRRMAWKHARPNLSSRGAKRLPGLALVKRRLEVYRRMAWKHARPNLSSRGAKRLPGLALVKRRLEVYRRMAWKHARPNLSSRGAKRLPGLALVKRRLEVYRRMAWKHARPNLSSRGAKRLPGLALVKRRLEVYRRMAWKHARPNLSSRGAKRLPGLALVKRRLEVYRRMAWKHARPNLSSRGAKRLPGLALVKRRLEVYRRMAWKHARPNLSSRGAKRLPGLALVKRRLEVYRRMAWKHARPNLSSRGAKRLPGLALVKRRLEVYRRMAWKHARPNLSSRGAKRLPGLALVKRRLEVYRRMAWKHARPNLSSRGAKRLPGLALVKRRLEVYRRMAWKHARPNLSSRGAKRLPGLALVKRRLEVYRRMAWKHARPNLSSRGAKRLPGLALVKRRLEVYRRMAWKHARPNLSSRGAKRLPGLALVKRRLEVYRRMAWKHARPNLSSRGAKRLPGLALVKRRLEVYRRMAWKHARPNLSSRGAKRLPGLALVKRRLEVYRRMAWKHARPNLSSRGAKRLPGLALVKRRLEVYRRMAWKHARPNLSSRGAKRLPGLALVKRRLEVYRRMAWKHARPNLSSRGAKRLPGLALVKRRLEVYRRMAWKHARPNLSSRGAKRLPGLALVKRRLEVYRRMAWKHARPNLSSRGAKRLPGLALVKRRLEVYRRMAWKHARPNLSSRGAKRLPGLALVTANTELSEVESDFLMLTQRALLEQHIQMKTMHSGWGLPTLLRSSLQAVMASSPECSSIEACPQPEDEIVMIGEEAFFSPETTRKCVESHAKQRIMLQDFGLPNTAEVSLAEFFPPSTCNEALASKKEATVDVPRLPASPASTKESEANDSALLVATSKKQKAMPYKIPKDAPVQIKPPMSKKKSVQKKRGLPQKIVDFFKALIVCKLPRSEETVDCYKISSVLGCPSFSVQIGKGHIELFNSSKKLTIYSSDLSKIARTSFRVTDLHKHNDLYLQLIKRLCETGHGTIHSSLIQSWTVFGTGHKLSIRTPPAISKTCLRTVRKLMFFVEQDAIDCIEKNLRQKHLMSKWWFPSPHTDSACKMALARKPAPQLTHRCRVAIESPSTKILSGDSLHQLELQIAKQCIEVRLGAIPLAVKISLKAMYSVQTKPLPKQTTVCKSPKCRNSAPIFAEQRILEPIEMNLKKKYLVSLWGLPSLYVNSLMAKWLPLPPCAVHVGGVNTVSSKEKLFLNEEIRELIELHVRKKRLHQELGLPVKLWKIFNWFTPRPSALSGPKKTKVNRVVLTKKPFFITQKTHLCLDYHIKRVQMQQRDGLPENIIQFLQHFMPSAPEIPESTPHSPIEECKGPLRDPVKGLSETRDATTRALVDAWDPKQHSQSSKQKSSPRETLKESKKTEIIFLQLHLVQKYIEIHLQQFPSHVVKSWNSVQTSEIDELAKTVLSSRISNLPRPTYLTFMEQFAIEQINQNLIHKHLMLMSAMADAESSKTLAPQACTWSTTHTRPKRAVREFVDMQTSVLAGEKRDALKCHVDPKRLQYDPTLPFASQRTTVLSPMPAKLTVTKPKFPTEVNIRPVELTFIEKATEEKLVSSSRSSLASRARGLSIDKELKPQKLQMSKQESPSRGRGPMFVLAKKRNTNIFKKWTKQRRARAMESKKHNIGTIRQCSVLDTLAIGVKWVDLNMNLESPPSLCGVLSPSTNLFPTTIHKPCSRGPRFNLDGPYIEFSAMETSFLGCKVRTHLDWHVRKKSLQQECSLPQVVQNSLQMLIPPTQYLLRSPYNREAKLKILPLIWKLEFIDEGIKEQLEFHIQRLIVQKRFGLSRHIQDELKQSLLSFPTSDVQISDDQDSVGSFSTRSEASLATKGSIAAEDKPQRFTDAYATTASQFNNQLEQHLPRKCLEEHSPGVAYPQEKRSHSPNQTIWSQARPGDRDYIQLPRTKQT